MVLIAGLGNPGEVYAGTRHNIGFDLVHQLADVLSVTFKTDSGHYQVGEGHFKGEKVILIKPTTFMNRSGTAVKKAIDRYHVPFHRCLICYDDINLPVGKIRLRPKGSAGGHNGLADILQSIQTTDIPRLRIGIGNDFAPGKQSDYVLSPFSNEQQQPITEALEAAEEAVLTFIREGINTTMNQFN